MNTPSTTAHASSILAALLPLKDNSTYAALSVSEKNAELDSVLEPVGDFKAVLTASDLWEIVRDWLREVIDELIDSAEEIWDNLVDQITDHLEVIAGMSWYWMPLPPMPIPLGGV